MFAVFLLILVSYAQVCSDSENTVGGDAELNAKCNSRGWCDKGECVCCDQLSSKPWCLPKAGIVGTYAGTTCDDARTYYMAKFGFVVKEDEVTCKNDGESSAEPDLVNATSAVISQYDGQFQSRACKICTVGDPCDEFASNVFTTRTPPTSGVLVNLATFYNSHHNPACPQSEIDYACAENVDRGITAKEILKDALDGTEILKDISNAMGSDNLIEQFYLRELYDDSTGGTLTRQPSATPTETPTYMPTEQPTIIKVRTSTCKPYAHTTEDFNTEYGVGSSCRGNIDESWPGGRSCDSPYLICLPQENTPARDEGRAWHFNDTHRYNVQECQRECLFDQRCRGIEFVADANSHLGNCTLIDDIETLVVNPSQNYDFDYKIGDNVTNLDSSVTGGAAMCFEKKAETCHPYIGASTYNNVTKFQTILDCYCPNNRKGSYTKKVKRTVENTRYCGDDTNVDERIKMAQANRMFHLCENWCLFNTLNPEQESWYWDPWNTCWYETYSGRGAHRGYCDRVIRNPDSIELQFVNRRADNFISCDKTRTPTEAPVEDANVTYFLSEEVASCDEACSSNSMTCAADQTARVFSSEQDLKAVFQKAGFTCNSENIIMNRTNWEGWALPGLGYGRICANRLPTLSHLEDLDSDCNRKIGEGWRRLCACY